MKLRQQSKDYDPVSKSKESDYDDSEDTDQGLCVDDRILPIVESYWCAEHEFTNVYDDELQYEDELWLSTVSWAMVANKGEMKLSPTFKSVSKPVSVSALALPSQFGDASISWYSALRDCWANASLLPLQEEVLFGSKLSPAQQELARGAAGSNPQEHMSQGSEPSQSMGNNDGRVDPPPVPFDPGDILPWLLQ